MNTNQWSACPFCGGKLDSFYDSFGTTLNCGRCHGKFNFPAFEHEVKEMWERARQATNVVRPRCRCHINAKYNSRTAWRTGKLPKPCPVPGHDEDIKNPDSRSNGSDK